MKLGANCNAKRAAILVAALSCLFACTELHAANKSTSMNVKLTVAYGCALNVTNMDFGTVPTVTGTETATSNVTVNCSPGTLFLLSFQPTFSFANISRNSTLTSIAGGTVNFSMALQGFFGFTSTSTTINGQLAATPGAAPGVYQSTETLYVIY